MSDDEQEPGQDLRTGRVLSGYGIASAVLGVVAVVAVVAAALIWVAHHAEQDELAYRTRVLQAAAEWTGVLINMTPDTLDTDLATLYDGTVGALNAEFETVVEPFGKLVQTLDARTVGQVDSVALETVHHDPPGGGQPSSQALEGLASRTDTVLVVATSASENAGTDQPQTVRWTLRLDVSDVDGELLISRLEPIR